MIGYATLGTNDFDKACEFYNGLLGELGAQVVMNDGRICIWAAETGMLAVAKPFDGAEATVGNGSMVALSVASPDAVKKMHAKALELGASDEGEPGPRGDTGMHFGYVRDLDGNKLAFYAMA